MIIIGLTGEKLSGKGTVSDYLVENHGYRHYRFSEILEDICDRLYLPNTRDNQIEVALMLREKFGPEILAHVLKKDIEKAGPERAVVDGIRYWEEYGILKNLPGFHLAYVTASLENRFTRQQKRHEKEGESDMDMDEFEKQEQAPTEVMIQELGKKAEFTVKNDGTFDELYNKIEEICRKLN